MPSLFRNTRARIAIALVLALALPALGSAPVVAHARLTASDPADGAVLDTAPTSVRLSFSETVLVTHMAISRPDDDPVESQREGAMRPADHVVARFDALPPGQYRLQWRAQSVDGHPMSGSIGFTVR